MKTVQVSRRSASYRRRLLAAGALSAVVALSHVDSAAAADCSDPNTYYDGEKATGTGDTFLSTADCDECTLGTTADAVSNGSGATFCEGIAAGYYGTVGDTTLSTGKHAVVAACPSGSTWTSDAITTGGPTTIADCYKSAPNPTDNTMYGKSGDGTNVYYCPSGTESTVNAAVSKNSFCSVLKLGYTGTAGTAGTAGTSGSHATVTGCASGYYIATAAKFAAQSSNDDASGLVCTSVPANKYFATTTSDPLEVTSPESPTSCPGGSETTRVGSTSLAECVTPAGKYLKVGSTTASDVSMGTTPANWYSKGGVSVTDTTKATNVAADDLDVATHSSETKDIQPCPRGSEQSLTGQGSCSLCAAGETSVPGSVCALCGVGAYNDVSGSTSCTNCPTINGVATKTLDTGSSAVEYCYADLDAAQAATIGALEQVPGFIATNDDTELQLGKLRVFVCPKGTYGKTWDLANILDAKDNLKAAGATARTYCESTLPGYYGYQPGGAHAGASIITVTECPENMSSDAESSTHFDCFCVSGYYNNGAECVAWPATDAATTTGATPAAESAGASTPIAVALAAAAAVPLLL